MNNTNLKVNKELNVFFWEHRF